jgi:hypothetical protein
MKVIITVEGNNGEHLYEVERELEYDIVNDKFDKGTYVEVVYPEWAGVINRDNPMYEAIELAERHLNENPELWIRETEPADYSGATEGDR